jgi:hypothetical protein
MPVRSFAIAIAVAAVALSVACSSALFAQAVEFPETLPGNVLG